MEFFTPNLIGWLVAIWAVTGTLAFVTWVWQDYKNEGAIYLFGLFLHFIWCAIPFIGFLYFVIKSKVVYNWLIEHSKTFLVFESAQHRAKRLANERARKSMGSQF